MNGKKIAGSILKVGAVLGAIGGILYLKDKKVRSAEENLKFQKNYYALAQQWIMNKNENRSMMKYFNDRNINSIAIYGMGTLGEALYEELKNTDIKIKYFIDKNATELYYGVDGIEAVGLDGITSCAEVDAIIVTPVNHYDSIVTDLENEGVSSEIISLEDVIYGL